MRSTLTERSLLAGIVAIAALACPLIIACTTEEVVVRRVKGSSSSGRTPPTKDDEFVDEDDDDDKPSTDCSLLCTNDVPAVQDAGPPAPPAEPAACQLPELAAPQVITPGFMQVDKNDGVLAPAVDPNVKMEAMAGTYTIDKATVWLPEVLNGLVKPEESTGTVQAGAIVVKDRHRFSFHAKVSVASKRGPQNQSIDVESYGTQALTSGVIKLTSACDDKPIPQSAIEFIDNGNGRGTFLLRTPATGPNKKPTVIITTLEATRK